MYLQKSVHIWCLYLTKVSTIFVLKPLENLENSGNFTLKFLSEPCIHPDLIANWFLILFSGAEFFNKCWIFSNKRDQNIALITGTESELFLINILPVHLYIFRSQGPAAAVKTKRWRVRSCLLRIFMVWPIYYTIFFQDSVKLFQGKSSGKSDFVIKSLITPSLRE